MAKKPETPAQRAKIEKLKETVREQRTQQTDKQFKDKWLPKKDSTDKPS